MEKRKKEELGTTLHFLSKITIQVESLKRKYSKERFQEVDVMIQTEHLESKMPKKHLEEDVEYGYIIEIRAWISREREVWARILSVNNQSIGGN